MNILSIDTTAKTAAACVSRVVDGEVFPLCDSRLNSTLTHSESILPMIDFCLKNAKISPSEVDVIAISAGPGSFTGVRIGIATVKGLAFANKSAKCVPVSALESLAHNVDDERRGTVVCACMDARREQFYNALFSCDGRGNIKRLCDDRAVSARDLFDELKNKYSSKRIVLVGDGAALAKKLFDGFEGSEDISVTLARGDRILQDACSVARCAYLHIDEAVEHEKLVPVYLRMSQAERERNERIGK